MKEKTKTKTKTKMRTLIEYTLIIMVISTFLLFAGSGITYYNATQQPPYAVGSLILLFIVGGIGYPLLIKHVLDNKDHYDNMLDKLEKPSQ